MRRLAATLLASLVLLVTPFAAALSQPAKDKGLFISPLRQFITVYAGQSKTSSITVGNFSSKALLVTLSVQKFNVADYTYDYRFSAPQPDWLSLSTSPVTLQPNESKTINYTVATPADAAPGGNYYTLLASAQLTSQGVKTTVQAASLLYLTINGKLVTSNQLNKSTIQRFNFGNSITYSLDVLDTGNVHYFIYTTGQLRGLLTGPAPSKEAHLLMPGSIRTISDTIPSPKLPGIYPATYGYSTDEGQWISRTSWVVFIPPWSIAFLLLLILLVAGYLTRKRKSADPAAPTRS